MGIKILWFRELNLTLDVECGITVGAAGRVYYDAGLGGDNVVITVRSDEALFSFGLTKLACSLLRLGHFTNLLRLAGEVGVNVNRSRDVGI
jgi:hypothetical protein